MSESTLKCENNESIFRQNYAQKLFIAFKMAYSFCFGLSGNLDFPDFLQKNFYNINYWWVKVPRSVQNFIDKLYQRTGPVEEVSPYSWLSSLTGFGFCQTRK